MNRHPIDRMHDIKDIIRSLQNEYDSIRNRVLTGEIDKTGDQYEATTKLVIARKTDFAKAMEILDQETYDLIVSNTESIHLKINEIKK